MLLNAKYSKGIVELDIPRQIETVMPHTTDTEIVDSPTIEIEIKRLMETISFQKDSNVCIVVNDNTRRCGTERILHPLLHLLTKKKIRSENITILIAAGAHSGVSIEDAPGFLGEIPSEIKLKIHRPNITEELHALGVTSRGTPVQINRRLLESDIVICIGGVSFHYFAGFGGGVKSLIPGCAGLETIKVNHSLSLSGEGSGLHPGCRSGNTVGNPVHEDLLEAYNMLEPAFSVTTVVNATNEIEAIFVGDLLEAHLEARNKLLEMYSIEVNEPADLVIASCGGYPRDIDLVQAHKSLRNAAEIMAKNGKILLLAKCAEGLGSEAIEKWIDLGSPSKIKKAALESYDLNAQTALSLLEIGKLYKVGMVTELSTETVEKLGFRKIDLNSDKDLSKFIRGNGRAYWLPDAHIIKVRVKDA